MGQLSLGRPLPLAPNTTASPSVATLTRWRDANATQLQRLLEGTVLAKRHGSGAAAAAVARSCLGTRLDHNNHAGRPVVSVLLEYFKRPAVVSLISAALRASCADASVGCELVVNVDNPHEAGAWAAEVADGFVVPVFSANVHESRGYNRAAKVARGDYLVVWQDDQIPPTSGGWLTDMLRLFAARPRLGILGLNKYRLCRHREPNNRWGPTPWNPDPLSGVAFTFAQLVDFAPMAIRTGVFRSLGGLEEGWSRRGDCGIVGDWELCVRAWVAGWQVGYMPIAGRTDDASAPGGTHTPLSSEACWGRQGHVGREALRLRYANLDFFNDMCGRLWLLNTMSFSLPAPDKCPYASRDTAYGNCSAPRPGALAAAAKLMAQHGQSLQR